jgi:pyruvate dehydrogenase E2 component (dihydrolipoamide acetyltransferase)
MPAITLPDLGEGVESGTIVKVLVSAGDELSEGQPVLEIELDKATVELPSPLAGKVGKVLVKAGDSVSKGQELIQLDGNGASEKKADDKKAEKPKSEKKAEPKSEKKAEPKSEKKDPEKEPDATARSDDAVEDAKEAEAPAKASAPAKTAGTTKAAPAPAPRAGGLPLPASPAVRKLARHLGLDLSQVAGTGERGRITLEDVANRVKGNGASLGGGAPALPSLPDFAAYGEVAREPLSGIRKKTAEAMTRSWTTIPAVAHHELVDITDLEAGRKAFKETNPSAKVTMTVIILKAVVHALKTFPTFNASLDLGKNELVLKRYYHVGVAVDTEHGLLVPVLRDVDQKSIVTLAQELDDLAARARAKKLGLDDMRGATFTVSNLGGIGGTGFSPIVNWPELAILGVSRAREQYVVSPNGPVARLLMPISLTYDHRVIDGAAAARFAKLIADDLSRPTALLFQL